MAGTLLLLKIIDSVGLFGVKSPCKVVPLKEYSTTVLPSLTNEKLVCPLKLKDTCDCTGKDIPVTTTLVKKLKSCPLVIGPI
jgi:hypothetical protein